MICFKCTKKRWLFNASPFHLARFRLNPFPPFCHARETSRSLLASRMAKATKFSDFKNSPTRCTFAYTNKFYSTLICRENASCCFFLSFVFSLSFLSLFFLSSFFLLIPFLFPPSFYNKYTIIHIDGKNWAIKLKIEMNAFKQIYWYHVYSLFVKTRKKRNILFVLIIYLQKI